MASQHVEPVECCQPNSALLSPDLLPSSFRGEIIKFKDDLQGLQPDADPDICSLLMELFSCLSDKQLLQVAKKIVGALKPPCNFQSPTTRSCIKILTGIYLRYPTRHPLKSILRSLFQNFPEEAQNYTADYLITDINHLFCWQQCPQDEGKHRHLRAVVDALLSLLENFPLGEKCLKTSAVQGLCFLSQSLQEFLETFRCLNLPVVQCNEAMHHCLAACKSINKMLQKFSDFFTEMVHSKDEETHLLLEQIVLLSCRIIQEERILVDCQTNGSMVLVILLQLWNKDDFSLLLSPLFHQVPFCQVECQFPPWLNEMTYSELLLTTLPASSSLSLIFAILALASPSELIQPSPTSPDNSILFDAILDQLFSTITRSESSACKLLGCKCLALWTAKIGAALKTDKVCKETIVSLTEERGTLSRILDYIWTAWEDHSDAVRLSARNIFQNVISVYNEAAVTCHCETNLEFICVLTTRLLQDVSWSSKGKYGALCCLVDSLGANTILQLEPNIANSILLQVREQQLASYASELYEKLVLKHKDELWQTQFNEDNPNELTIINCRKGSSAKELSGQWKEIWCQQWVQPVIHLLCSEPADSSLNVHVTEYILPKLLKSSQHVLGHMLSIIWPAEESQQNSSHMLYKNLGALLTCLRRAKSLGLLYQLQKADNDKDVLCWNRVIPFSILTHALTHLKSQIRLDAYALLCENIKMTEPLTEEELPLLLGFLKENMNNQIPAFRQSLVSYTKKLFTRLKESSRIIKRYQKTANQETEKKTTPRICTYSSYEGFLFDLMKIFLQGIFPGSPFARRTTSLSLISSMVEVFRVDATQESAEEDLFPMEAFTKSECQTLLECLTDTFEENKMAALKILTSPQVRKRAQILQDTVFLEELLSAAMALSESTRPQDCSTAAYLLRLLLQQDNIGPVIENYKPNLVSNSSTPFLQIPATIPGSQKQKTKTNTLLLVQQLIQLLNDQLEVAKHSLVHAAATRPMYPTIHCIRYIIADFNFRQCSNPECWQEVFDKLLSVCLEAAAIVSPVVHNSSPEGNIPEGAIMGPGLDVSALVTTHNEDQKSWLNAIGQSKELVTLMPEYLVVCSWRSIKEISLLLGQICLQVPVEDPTPTECNLINQQPPTSSLLNLKQVLSIGEYFTTQLLESKHRGAFELAYAGFVKMCDMLWKSPVSVLHKLPGQWLEEIMVCISSEDDQSRLCATRRSAGIPFYIQAIVSSEPLSSGRPFFKQTMKNLIKLGTDKFFTSSQVHALNILRSLYRDTRLAEDVAPYVADGLKVAILGFSSHLWAVTNSATLLLSALMTRIFGVNRSKLEGNVSRKNCQTGRTFFTHHPSLYEFLLDQLSQASQNVKSNSLTLSPVLYPILLVLGRLYPSSLDGIDSGLKLDAFIPYIINCAGSPILKTREMAAKALKPLAGKDHLTSTLCILLSYIPSEPAEKISQNYLHGLLLQIQQLIKLLPSLPFSLHENEIENVLQEFSKRLWLLSLENSCLITRQVAVEISMGIITQKCETKERLSSTYEKISSTLVDTCNRDCGNTALHQPGQVYYLITIAKVHLWRIEQVKVFSGGDHSGIDRLLDLLNSPVYEVRFEVLTWMEAILTQGHSLECGDQNGMTCSCYLNTIGQSTELFDLLVRMTDQEQHPLCLAKVLSVLCCPTFSAIISTSTEFDPSEIMNQVLNLLKKSTREEVQESAIRYASVLLPLVYHQGSHERNRELFSTCCNLLQEFSATERNAETQLACALFLQKNATILLRDPKNSLDHSRLAFWQIVFNLLQEDDLDVKDTTAEIFNQLQPSHPVPVHCAVAMNYLLKELLLSNLANASQDDSLHLLGTLISWMGPTQLPSQETKERLFDRGEMNTYRDNVEFLQTLGSHLENQLNGHNDNDPLNPAALRTHNPNVQSLALLSEEMRNQLQSLADPNIKLQFLTISTKLVSRLAQSRPHTLTNAFWDAAAHQTDVQDSFQFLLPLSYLQLLLPQTFPTPEEEDLVKSFEEVCMQIQTVFGLSNYAANGLSMKLLLILERMQKYWTTK